MNNIEFENKELKSIYKSIFNLYPGLSGVIFIIQNGKSIKVTDIKSEENEIRIYVSKNKKDCIIVIDLLRNIICLIEPNKEYTTLYSNHSRKHLVPIGYLYQKDNRKIIEKYMIKLNTDMNKLKDIEIDENGTRYFLHLKKNDYYFDEKEFIKQLLYEKEFNSFRELFIIIYQLINGKNVDIKLSDANGSIVTTQDDLITKYIEYQEKDNEYQKIYLENNEFFIEKKVKEEYQDDMTSLVKKIGVINGKKEG